MIVRGFCDEHFTLRSIYQMKAFSVLAGVAGLLLAATVGAAELKSGPQPGEKIPGPFHPLNITGGKAGQKHCLV